MTKPTSDDTASAKFQFKQLAAFASITDKGLERLQKHCSLLRFRIGQPLTSSEEIPKYVYWLLEGQCRLLGLKKDRLTTLARLGPGSAIGLASLISVNPCEAVTAATDTIVVAIPDEIIAEIYSEEPSFRKWCNETIWPAELADLITSRSSNTSQGFDHLIARLTQINQSAKVIGKNNAQDQLVLEQDQEKVKLILASANSNLEIWEELDPAKPMPLARGPFDLRILSIPTELLEQKHGPSKKNNPSAVQQLSNVNDAPDVLFKSGLDIGQKKQLDNFKLIRGKGIIEETVACFQMLSMQMNLPFRRDAIEKILRDSLRRGQKPNLQLCGKLAASLGLHVISAKAPSALGIRLQVPCMVSWRESFALVIRSDAEGLTLASPSKGIVEFKPTNSKLSSPKISMFLSWSGHLTLKRSALVQNGFFRQ